MITIRPNQAAAISTEYVGATLTHEGSTYVYDRKQQAFDMRTGKMNAQFVYLPTWVKARNEARVAIETSLAAKAQEIQTSRLSDAKYFFVNGIKVRVCQTHIGAGNITIDIAASANRFEIQVVAQDGLLQILTLDQTLALIATL